MLTFFKQFLKNPANVGSIIQSSNFLISTMLKDIDFGKDMIIVELGAGTGGFTKKILKKISKDSKLLSFEINPYFVKKLKKIDDSRLEVIQDSAEYIAKYLEGEKADYIVSALPLGSLEKNCKGLVCKILKATKTNLKQGGGFYQFQYFLSNKKDVCKYYENIDVAFQPLNIPPAFVYRCKNK